MLLEFSSRIFIGICAVLAIFSTLRPSCAMAKFRGKPIFYPLYVDRTVCRTIPGLSKDQIELCKKEPDATLAAMKGLQQAVKECQHQFSSQRWNCSSLVTKKYPYTSPLFNKGYRETSFAQAIFSAGISIAIARECSQGALLNCGCDSKKYQISPHSGDWKWNGCSHNIRYATRFAKMFLDRREKARDIHANVNHHNNRIGRMVVKNNMQIKCKCHGVSGSCEFKTCWRISPDIRIIGNVLGEKYKKAVLFSPGNRGTKRFKPSRRSNVRKRRRSREKSRNVHQNLIYYQKSPSFCDADRSVDFPGTTGRLCNRTNNASDGTDNCSSLCCGRGYNLLRRNRTQLCNCKFQWCCEVQCENCSISEWISVCK